MKIIYCNNYEEISKRAANIIVEQISKKSTSSIGFATGSSPLGMYQELIKAYKNKQVNFKKITSFNLDEYVGIDHQHKESYHHYMQENLFKHININPENIFIPSSDKNIKLIIEEYEKKLKEHPIDLQILGLGTNGHIGFNEPGTPFSSTTTLVELDEQTRKDNARFFKTVEEVPTQAITMGIKSIMKAKKIVLLVFGEHKKEALYQTVYGEITPQNPSSILQLHTDVTIITDNLAAQSIRDI